MRGAAVAGLLAVAILVGAGVGYLSNGGSVKTVTSVSTTSRSLTTTLFVSNTATLTTTTTIHDTTTTTASAMAPSLEMIASVYPATITAGQNITINWGVFNPLSTTVEVKVPIFLNPYLSPCPLWLDPTTFYLYRGHLTSSNLTGNTPLVLYNESIIIECFAGENTTLVFQPHSDRATASFFSNFTQMAVMDTTANFRGYWTGTSASGYALNKFQPGMYTVMFNGTLGQQEFDYFTVNH